MPDDNRSLGKLIAVHALSPAHIQRAVFITILSFLFFLAMMFGFYIRQSIVYFVLASAFLIVYILTMFSWVAQRKTLLQVFENGIGYKKRKAGWDEITEVRADGTIVLNKGKEIVISPAINNLDKALVMIRSKAAI
jgi:hypothetical protein